jgi:transcriptional regulator with XRE-family HTH domain
LSIQNPSIKGLCSYAQKKVGVFMYNLQILSENIKLCAKNNGINVKTLLSDCELGKNTVGKIANGTDIGAQTIVKIAGYLGVSVDYLLGRENKKRPSDPQTRGEFSCYINLFF